MLPLLAETDIISMGQFILALICACLGGAVSTIIYSFTAGKKTGEMSAMVVSELKMLNRTVSKFEGTIEKVMDEQKTLGTALTVVTTQMETVRSDVKRVHEEIETIKEHAATKTGIFACCNLQPKH